MRTPAANTTTTMVTSTSTSTIADMPATGRAGREHAQPHPRAGCALSCQLRAANVVRAGRIVAGPARRAHSARRPNPGRQLQHQPGRGDRREHARGPGRRRRSAGRHGQWPGALTVEVLRPAGLSTVTRIAQMVERALAERTPRSASSTASPAGTRRWSSALAALLVAIPVLAFGQPFFDLADGTRGWLYRGLAMLIIACPCALIISIPVTVVSALARLAQLGVLVKGGAPAGPAGEREHHRLRQDRHTDAGRPAVTAIRGKDCPHPVAADATTAAKWSRSPPPWNCVPGTRWPRRSWRRPSARRGQSLPQAANGTAQCGRGVSGELGGQAGRRRLPRTVRRGIASTEVPECGGRAAGPGRTVMLVAAAPRWSATSGSRTSARRKRARLARTACPDAAVKTVMLTGDNRNVAEAIAEQIGGIDEVRAGLLPGQKLDANDRPGCGTPSRWSATASTTPRAGPGRHRHRHGRRRHGPGHGNSGRGADAGQPARVPPRSA